MMKKLSKIALLAAASAFMLAVFPACGDDEEEGGGNGGTPTVKITGGNSVTVGGTALELTASVENFPEGVTYDWTSSATDKATVEPKSDDPSKATVTAVAEGTAKITVTATAGDTVKSDEIEVTIKAEESLKPELTFPLSITPTTTGSTPAYPTTADTDKNLPYAFTSPVAYTVCTKKKFDTGKYNTGSETKTADRWNLGGALESSSGSYNCYIKFDSAPSAKMTVKFFNTNADRTITVVSGETKTGGKVKTKKTDGTNGDLMTETFTVTKGSEVYLGATASGIWVAEIIWEE